MKWFLLALAMVFFPGCAGSRQTGYSRGFEIERLQGSFPIDLITYHSPDLLKSDVDAKKQDGIEKEMERRMLPIGGILEIRSTMTPFNRIKIVDGEGKGIFNCLEVDYKDEVALSDARVTGAPYQDKETFMIKCPITVAMPATFGIRIIEVNREIGEFRLSKSN